MSRRRRSGSGLSRPQPPPPTISTADRHDPERALLDDIATCLAQSLPGVRHCQVVDFTARELQYRLLGARRYWHRHVKQDKSSARPRWEARLYEIRCRKSTAEGLRAAAGATMTATATGQGGSGGLAWHRLSRLAMEDVELRSLGFFESEQAAARAYDAAFRARDTALPAGIVLLEPSATSTLVRWVQATVVSEAFARRAQAERLGMVYEALLEFTSNWARPMPFSGGRGFRCVGANVRRLPHWRVLPVHVLVCAKTPAQWRPTTSSSGATITAGPGVAMAAPSDTDRLGPSHLLNDRALAVDTGLLPQSRGLAELVSLDQDESLARTKSVLPHFYHGLPAELKRMITDEEKRQAADRREPARSLHAALDRNSEATFLPRYLKRRREYVIAATRLQRLYRRRAQPRAIARLHRRHRAALTLQRLLRGHWARGFVRAYRRVLSCAALLVQAVFRSFASRRRTQAYRRRATQAAIDIARVYRGFVARVWVRWVRRVARSAVELQRVARGFVARQRVRRLRRARHKRQVLVPAARTIQRLWRGHRGRRLAAHKRQVHEQLTVLHPAALTIARVLRGFLARCLARRFQRATAAARLIQGHWRRCRIRRRWWQLLAWRRQELQAARIGALGRGFIARRFVRQERRRRYHQRVLVPAAIAIQRVFRGYVVRRRLEGLRDRVEAAITLQEMWRRRSRLRVLQDRLRGFRRGLREAKAGVLQRAYRCYRARQELTFRRLATRAREGKAAVAIQSAWRSHCARVQLAEFRYCARIERKARALTTWREAREDIEFDLEDARGDVKRLMRHKARALRRIRELKDMRLEWERRQPVVDKELSALTEEDLDRGWGEAFETERHILRFQLELSVEDMLGYREKIREYDAELEDLRLELEDLERDLEECILGETGELEEYRVLEVQHAQRMFATERARRIRLQRERWRVRDVRTNVIARQREDRRLVERELLAQRQVPELGVLGFENKRQLQLKLQEAIERVVGERAQQNQVTMALQRDAKVLEGFDAAIATMGKITQQYTFAYRTPKHDLRELVDSPMCDGCGRITCDCDARLGPDATHGKTVAPTSPIPRPSNSRSGKRGVGGSTNYGHPLRRKRNYAAEGQLAQEQS